MDFDTIIEYVFASEGGYVDHPDDPGGATNMGITLGTLSTWRGRKVTKAEVKNLTKSEAKEIYKKLYWLPVGGDALPAGLNYAVLDYAVHSGPDRAVRALQKLVGATVDGIVGPDTLKKVSAASDLRTVVNRYIDDRLTFLKGRKTWNTFGKGWKARIDKVRKLSLEGVETKVEVEKKSFNLATLIPVLITVLVAVFGSFKK